MPVPNDPLAILDRLSKGNISEADRDLLHQHLSTSGDQNTVQVGKYNVNIGQGQDIQIGDRIYQGVDADALKELFELSCRACIQGIQSKFSGNTVIPLGDTQTR